MESSLFKLATRYDFPEDSEDRLTQVVAACFNYSSDFRRIFLRFLGIDYPDCRAYPQLQESESRPDLWIRSGRRQTPVALIESKTKTKAQLKQLMAHEGVNAKHRFVIVEHPDGIQRLGWKVRYWADLADLLATSGSSCIICMQALEYFKEREIVNSFVTKSDLKHAGIFLDHVRYKDFPSCNGETLLALSRVYQVLEYAANFAREDQKFLRAFKLDRRFRTSVKISSWFDLEERENKRATVKRVAKKIQASSLTSSEKKILKDALKAQTEHVQNGIMLEKKIKVPRRKNGIDGLGLMLCQAIGGGKPNLCITVWQKNRFNYLTEWTPDDIPSKGLGAKHLAQLAIKTWIKALSQSHDF